MNKKDGEAFLTNLIPLYTFVGIYIICYFNKKLNLVRFGGLFYLLERLSELVIPIIGNIVLLPIFSGFIGIFKCSEGSGDEIT